MRRITWWMMAAAAACCLSGAGPLAKVTTAAGVQINGKEVPQKTAPSWPVEANDAVATANDPAILLIAGDRALMEPKTSVRMLERGGAARLEVDGGEVCLRTRSGSTLQVFAAGDELAVHHPFEGMVTFNAVERKPASVKASACQFPAPGWLPSKAMTPGAAAAAAGAAAASRVATGDAVPVASPSRR
jgi:hypothetical protein